MSGEDDVAAWLRRQAEADLAAARQATNGPWTVDGNSIRGAARTYAGGGEGAVLVVKRTWPQEAAHITRHDPRTEVARAESVLAVLDLHEKAIAAEASDLFLLDLSARTLMQVGRLLAYGYRYREGWKEGWKP